MYNSYFGFTAQPFTADSNQLLLVNPAYHSAYRCLRAAMLAKTAQFILLTGAAGSGKTTLLRHLMGELDDDIESIFVWNSHLDVDDLLNVLRDHLDLSGSGGTRTQLVQTLRTRLSASSSKQRVLVVDDVQNMADRTLCALGDLLCTDADQSPLLRVVLSGRETLEERLRDEPDFEPLVRNLGSSCRLASLDDQQVLAYITEHVQAAGYLGDDLFEREALAKLVSLARGTPRLINSICQQGLLLGYLEGSKRITAAMIRAVAADSGLDAAAPNRSSDSSSNRPPAEAAITTEDWRPVARAAFASGQSRALVSTHPVPARPRRRAPAPVDLGGDNSNLPARRHVTAPNPVVIRGQPWVLRGLMAAMIVAVAWLILDYSGVTRNDGVTVAESTFTGQSSSNTGVARAKTAQDELTLAASDAPDGVAEPTVGPPRGENMLVVLEGHPDTMRPVEDLAPRLPATRFIASDSGSAEDPASLAPSSDSHLADMPATGDVAPGTIPTIAPPPQSTPAVRTSTTEGRIAALAAQAQDRMARNRYTRPRGQSAIDSYRQILRIDPGNARALSGIRSIKSTFVRWAQANRARGELDKAQRQLETAAAIDPGDRAVSTQLRAVREERRQLADANRQSKRQNGRTSPAPWYATGGPHENIQGWGKRD